MRNIRQLCFLIAVACFLLNTSCKKFLDIAPPITTITTAEIFENNAQAEWAIAGAYTKLINGSSIAFIMDAANYSFGAGLATYLGGLSSDELVSFDVNSNDRLYVSQNKLTLLNYELTKGLWTSAYKLIYDANAVMEGIEASDSPQLIDSVRNQITGEALALRALGYFYLVNFYGDIPLVLTTDFNKTNAVSRSSTSKIYDQIIADLVRAKLLLSDDFSVGKSERVRINKWFAEALLARTYLYTKDFTNAILSANEVIGHHSLFSIELDIDNVFTKNSKEAIFQLKQTTTDFNLGTATPEGYLFLSGDPNYDPALELNAGLLNAFETGDKRKTSWVTAKTPGHYIPFKYKDNGQSGVQSEYYTVMRLAELYLIRAEAKVLLSPANKDEAIDDLNILRQRALIGLLPKSLTATQVVAAIEQERRIELFAEWGHRWFDLKRTNRAHDVLSAISYKQPWYGDYQFLYPIPVTEIESNNNLEQNPAYNNQR